MLPRSGRCPEVDIAPRGRAEPCTPALVRWEKMPVAVLTLHKGLMGFPGAGLLGAPLTWLCLAGGGLHSPSCGFYLQRGDCEGMLESRLMSKTLRLKLIKICTVSRAAVKWCSRGR